MNFNINDYEPVEERIKRFYEDHNDGRILTELVFDDGKRVVFKSYLYIKDLVVSTGYAEETKDEGSPVNKVSHMENAETSAIGRALANYNYSGDKRPSREEMDKVERSSVEVSKTDEDVAEAYEELMSCEHRNVSEIVSRSKMNPGRTFKRCDDCKKFLGWVD